MSSIVDGARWISFHLPGFNSIETYSGLDVQLTICSTYQTTNVAKFVEISRMW